MAIDRTKYNALIDDDGSNTVGTVWNKQQIKDVILDPADTALVNLDGSSIKSGTVPDARLSANIARRDQANTFVTLQQVAGTPHAKLLLTDTGQPANQKSFAISSQSSGRLYVAAADDAGGVLIPTYFDRAGNFVNSGDIYEKQRTTPMGHWIQIPYSAGLFTSNVGTWTVEAADVGALWYALIGRMLLISWYIINTTVSGGQQELRIALPSPFVCQLTTPFSFHFFDPIIGSGTGSGLGYAGSTVIALRRDIAQTPWSAQTNATHVVGQAFIPII